jgi:hypothetical protein
MHEVWKAFVAQAYSLTRPKTKFHPNHLRGQGGTLKKEFERNMGIERFQSKGIVTTNVYLWKKNSTWNFSQSLNKNH